MDLTAYGFFALLPAELRKPIYALCFSDNKINLVGAIWSAKFPDEQRSQISRLALLCTSKAIKNDALETCMRTTTFIYNLDLQTLVSRSNVSSVHRMFGEASPTAWITRLDVHIASAHMLPNYPTSRQANNQNPALGRSIYENTLDLFGGNTIKRESCKIFITVRREENVADLVGILLHTPFGMGIRRLTGFGTVSLIFMVFDGLEATTTLSLGPSYQGRDHAALDELMHLAQQILSPSLGPVDSSSSIAEDKTPVSNGTIRSLAFKPWTWSTRDRIDCNATAVSKDRQKTATANSFFGPSMIPGRADKASVVIEPARIRIHPISQFSYPPLNPPRLSTRIESDDFLPKWTPGNRAAIYSAPAIRAMGVPSTSNRPSPFTSIGTLPPTPHPTTRNGEPAAVTRLRDLICKNNDGP